MDKMTDIMALPLPRVLIGLFYWDLDLMDWPPQDEVIMRSGPWTDWRGNGLSQPCKTLSKVIYSYSVAVDHVQDCNSSLNLCSKVA